MKESKGAKILINISLEENNFKHFLGFRKEFKRLQYQTRVFNPRAAKLQYIGSLYLNISDIFCNFACIKKFHYAQYKEFRYKI